MNPLFVTRRAFGLLVAGSAVPAFAQKAPLRIGYVAALGNAPALIAQQQGYYARQGLSSTLTPFNDGPLIQQAVASGQLDVAYVGAPPVYQWYARGLDMRIVAKVNEGQAALVAKTGVPIQKLADLKGHKLASPARGSGMDVLLRAFVLQKAGLSAEKDLTVVQMPAASMNAALATGVVDAAFEWEPFVSQALLRGTARLVFDVNTLLPHYMAYTIAVPNRVLQSRRPEIESLLRAHHQAVEFLSNEPEAANRLIAAQLKIAPIQDLQERTVPPEAIVREARRRIAWADEINAGDRALVQRMMDASLALGFLSRALKANEVIDTSAWTSAVGVAH